MPSKAIPWGDLPKYGSLTQVERRQVVKGDRGDLTWHFTNGDKRHTFTRLRSAINHAIAVWSWIISILSPQQIGPVKKKTMVNYERRAGTPTPVRTESPAVGAADRDRVKAQMRRWQDQVLDLTKSNPLIGLNRSRVSKLLAIEPGLNEIFSLFAIDESQLRMPLVRKRPRQLQQSLLIPPDEDPDLVVEPGDISFEAKPLDLMRRLRRIHDNARTTLEERGVTTLYLTLGTLRWKDDQFGDSVSPLWMIPSEFESKGPDAPLRLCIADEDPQVNPALEYYLRERHKVQLPEIPDEPDKQSLTKFLRSPPKVFDCCGQVFVRSSKKPKSAKNAK